MGGMRIKELSKQKKISIVQLSEKLSVSRNTLFSYFRGESSPTLAVLKEISEVLEVPISELIGEDPQGSQPQPIKKRIETTGSELLDIIKVQAKALAAMAAQSKDSMMETIRDFSIKINNSLEENESMEELLDLHEEIVRLDRIIFSRLSF